jgi:tripartite-type tricarboxylate transporter receptor subunit TctC
MIGRVAIFAAALTFAAPAGAETPAEFYKGKTVTIITSTGAGGTYDLVARMVARHMPRHLPGNPTMVVQNMPGGGNVLATNFMYNIAPKDGTTIATIHNAMPTHQVLDGRGVRYDSGKFNWLGSTGPDNEVVFAWHTAGIKSIADAMRREVVLGGTGAGSGIVIIPTAMNNVLGTRFKIVTGYKSSEEINLALQRGEVQARAFGFGSIWAQHSEWLKDGTIVVLAQAGRQRDAHLPDVPLLTELAGNDEQRAVLKLISGSAGLGQPYVAPPELPADRLAALREAFAATLADKAFLDEAEKLRIEIQPMNAEETARVVADTISTSPEIVAKARAAMMVSER